MKIETFEMGGTQCLFENKVEPNLSESGVLPLNMGRINEDQISIVDLTGVAIQDIQIAKMVNHFFMERKQK
jgi:ornithine cyclodeaminase/alanine dehydrogenase-like protein (mu-crystallin family)